MRRTDAMMKRFGLAAILFMVLAAGCASQPNGILGNDIAGSDVEAVINQSLVWNVVLRHPTLTIGKASCPHSLDIAYGAVATCTLPVDGLAVPVSVVAAPQISRGFNVDITGSIVEKSRAERNLTALVAAGTGRRGDAHCAGPELRLMPRRQTMACTVSIDGKLIAAQLAASAHDDDEVYLQSPDSLRRRFDAADAYAERGIVPGSAARTAVTAIMQSMDGGELVRLHALGSISCPQKLDLRNYQHVACTVSVGGMPLTWTFSVPSSGGVTIENDRAVVLRDPIVAGIRTLYTRQFGMQAYDINCGKRVVGVLEPGTLFACGVTSGGKTDDVPITIIDVSGVPHLNGWRAVQGDPSDQ